jgi:hypothetical protein
MRKGKKHMNLRKVIIATTIVATSAGFAFAQSAPSPANQSGGGTSATSPAPTDPSTAGETGNTKGIPSRGTSVKPGTTGSGANEPTPSSNARESQEKNASPASPAAGAEKEK